MPSRAVLPRICIALGFSTVEQLLAHARREAQDGETFFEEPDAILYYPESVFLVDGSYAERGRDPLESRPPRRGIAKTRTSLRTLFRIVWKRAGLCRSHDRPRLPVAAMF